MPYISIKTTQKLTQETKIALTERLTKAFGEASSPDCAANIQYSIEDGLFMNFRGDYKSQSAHVYVHPDTLLLKVIMKKSLKHFSQFFSNFLMQKQTIYI